MDPLAQWNSLDNAWFFSVQILRASVTIVGSAFLDLSTDPAKWTAWKPYPSIEPQKSTSQAPQGYMHAIQLPGESETFVLCQNIWEQAFQAIIEYVKASQKVEYDEMFEGKIERPLGFTIEALTCLPCLGKVFDYLNGPESVSSWTQWTQTTDWLVSSGTIAFSHDGNITLVPRDISATSNANPDLQLARRILTPPFEVINDITEQETQQQASSYIGALPYPVLGLRQSQLPVPGDNDSPITKDYLDTAVSPGHPHPIDIAPEAVSNSKALRHTLRKLWKTQKHRDPRKLH